MTNTTKSYDVVGAMMRYEQGDSSEEEMLELFQHLVDTGTAWKLQGSYGRTAQALLDNGMISAPKGWTFNSKGAKLLQSVTQRET